MESATLHLHQQLSLQFASPREAPGCQNIADLQCYPSAQVDFLPSRAWQKQGLAEKQPMAFASTWRGVEQALLEQSVHVWAQISPWKCWCSPPNVRIWALFATQSNVRQSWDRCSLLLHEARRWSPGALSVLGSARGSAASACPASELSRKRKLMDWTVKQPYSTLKASFHHVRGSFGPILIWLVYLQQSICFNLQLMLQRFESWVRNFPCFPPKMSKVNGKKHRQMDLLFDLKIYCAKSKNVSLLSPLGPQCLVVLSRTSISWGFWSDLGGTWLGFDSKFTRKFNFLETKTHLNLLKKSFGQKHGGKGNKKVEG